jgi:hypothetical protein
MRFMEIANPEDQLSLWRLISDNVWSAVMAQAKQAAAQKAQAAVTPKPPPAKSPVPPQTRSVAPSRPSPLPSSQPVLRPTHSSSFSQADCRAILFGTKTPLTTRNSGFMTRNTVFLNFLIMGMRGIAKIVWRQKNDSSCQIAGFGGSPCQYSTKDEQKYCSVVNQVTGCISSNPTKGRYGEISVEKRVFT